MWNSPAARRLESPRVIPSSVSRTPSGDDAFSGIVGINSEVGKMSIPSPSRSSRWSGASTQHSGSYRHCDNSVKVAVRCRPLGKREYGNEERKCIELSKNKITIALPPTYSSSSNASRPAAGNIADRYSKSNVDCEVENRSTSSKKSFEYDFCYGPENSQEDIFHDIGVEVLENAFAGYNATVFVYGQTGSGKTYTMLGDERNPGLIPRVCRALLEKCTKDAGNDFNSLKSETPQSAESTHYRLTASFVEIYNEKCLDLMAQAKDKSNSSGLRVREDPKVGPYVAGLSSWPIKDEKDIERMIRIGTAARTTAYTGMNESSSRSHAIFTLEFTQTSIASDLRSATDTASRINLVDLAGSERVKASGVTGKNITETSNINRSLHALGRVINALSISNASLKKDGSLETELQENLMSVANVDTNGPSSAKKTSAKTTSIVIPYRDSVLTWLLKNSLGGNSRTTMLATVNPSSCNYDESLCTLLYAQRCTLVVNRPFVNRIASKAIVDELRDEISELRERLTKESESREASVSLAKTIRDEYETLEKNSAKVNSKEFLANQVIIDELKQQVTAKDEKIRKQELTIVEFNKTHDSNLKAIAEVEMKLESKSRDAEALQQKLKSAVEQLGQRNSDRNNLTGTKKALETQVTSLRKELSCAKSELESVRRCLRIHEKQLINASDAAANKDRRISVLESERNKRLEKISNLEQQIQEWERSRFDAKSKPQIVSPRTYQGKQQHERNRSVTPKRLSKRTSGQKNHTIPVSPLRRSLSNQLTEKDEIIFHARAKIKKQEEEIRERTRQLDESVSKWDMESRELKVTRDLLDEERELTARLKETINNLEGLTDQPSSFSKGEARKDIQESGNKTDASVPNTATVGCSIKSAPLEKQNEANKDLNNALERSNKQLEEEKQAHFCTQKMLSARVDSLEFIKTALIDANKSLDSKNEEIISLKNRLEAMISAQKGTENFKDTDLPKEREQLNILESKTVGDSDYSATDKTLTSNCVSSMSDNDSLKRSKEVISVDGEVQEHNSVELGDGLETLNLALNEKDAKIVSLQEELKTCVSHFMNKIVEAEGKLRESQNAWAGKIEEKDNLIKKLEADVECISAKLSAADASRFLLENRPTESSSVKAREEVVGKEDWEYLCSDPKTKAVVESLIEQHDLKLSEVKATGEASLEVERKRFADLENQLDAFLVEEEEAIEEHLKSVHAQMTHYRLRLAKANDFKNFKNHKGRRSSNAQKKLRKNSSSSSRSRRRSGKKRKSNSKPSLERRESLEQVAFHSATKSNLDIVVESEVPENEQQVKQQANFLKKQDLGGRVPKKTVSDSRQANEASLPPLRRKNRPKKKRTQTIAKVIANAQTSTPVAGKKLETPEKSLEQSKFLGIIASLRSGRATTTK